MRPNDDVLKRMLRAARRPGTGSGEPIPFGFAGRVAALWVERKRAPLALSGWERLCGRAAIGMAVAALLAGLAVWQTWVPVTPDESAVLDSRLSELVFLP